MEMVSSVCIDINLIGSLTERYSMRCIPGTMPLGKTNGVTRTYLIDTRRSAYASYRHSVIYYGTNKSEHNACDSRRVSDQLISSSRIILFESSNGLL